MFHLTRRQAHATLAGVVAAAGYLAAAELGSKKPVRVSGLFTLASLAMAGMAGASLNNKASVKANLAHQRIDVLVPAVASASAAAANAYQKTGGPISGAVSVSGTVTVTGDSHVSGDHYVTGQSHTHLTAPAGFGNVQVQGGSGLGILTGNLSMNSNSITNANSVGNGGSPVSLPDGSSHGNSLIMNNNNAFTFGHITSNQIGPGTTRAGLSGTQTLATLTTRSNYHNGVLQACGVCY